MEIQITPKNTTGVERAVEVTVPAAEMAAAEERATRRYASQARLPGFRPGKAPAAIVRKRFADAIRNETIESVVREAYTQIVEKDDVKIASQPHVHGLKFEDGQPLTFEFHYEVRPTVTLARTGGFRLKQEVPELTEAQVKEELDRIREEKATWTPIDDKPMEGDMVRVGLAVADAEGKIGEQQDVPFILGDKRALPGIEELIMEAKPGETLERAVRWPDDFPDESQRGISKVVRMTLHETKRKILPEVDDAFAREVGDFDSVAALTDAVRADIQKYLEREADLALRQKLMDEIISANAFDVPQSWVRELVRNYAELYQAGEAQASQFEAEFRTIAERQIKRDLIIETIAAEQNLTATEKDLDDQIAEQAKARKVSPGELYAALERGGRLKDMERSITEDKVFHWLMDQNEVA